MKNYSFEEKKFRNELDLIDGSFITDYTDIAVGSDNAFHALWTDMNNEQTVAWSYGFQLVPTGHLPVFTEYFGRDD